MDDLLKQATDAERAVAEMVLRNLIKLRPDKICGEVAFRLTLNEGGIRDKWLEMRARQASK